MNNGDDPEDVIGEVAEVLPALTPSPSVAGETSGMLRAMVVRRIPPEEVPQDRSAIEGEGFAATFASFDAPPRHDTWHHHGDHDVIAYLLRGSINIETPDDGVIEMRAGDLVHIERRTVHREVYEGHIEIVGFDVGTGPGRIQVAEGTAP